MAAAWAVLRHIGDDGYLELAMRAGAATAEIAAGIGKIGGLRLVAKPDSTLLAVSTSDGAGFDLFTVADEMRGRGWYVQPQFARGPSPVNLHLTITAANRGHEPEFLADLRASVDAARAAGPVRVDENVLAFVRALDPDALTPEQFAAAPEPLRERLLLKFLGLLYRQGTNG